MKENILFDLDGTLTNPEKGIINSVIYALDKFSVKAESRESLRCFIGPPLVDSFMEKFGFSSEDAQKALMFYREYFSVTGLYENEVYYGIENMLDNLKKAGKRVIIATSKPDLYAEKILKHFDLFKYIDYLSGATMDEKRNKKADVIEYALKELLIEKEKTVMVGDRKFDILGAHKNGVEAVGVLYGFGDRKELTDSGADWIVDSVSELEKLLLAI